MKKNTSYLIKSAQDYFYTFRCCFSAGFSVFLQTSMFTKKLFFYAPLFLLVFGQVSLYSQKVSGAAVKANFGIDADIYANHEQFTTPSVPLSNVDDWFLNTAKWDDSGLGVVDVDFAAHPLVIPGNATPTLAELITFLKSSAGKNFPFERRMSRDKGTTVGSYLWIDAVYGRDGIATQGNNDATVFTKTTDKNGQNPATWNLGSGGTPQKNDIVDVYGHLRRDPSDVAFNTTDGNLWGFGGATTISADGNSHNDFEFFRTNVTFDGSKLIGSGPNEGHTAWQFGGVNGAVSVSGDILVAVDFENGGTKPLGSVRVWMKKTDAVVATFNANFARPFDITGVFDQTSGATYGYAEIAAKGSVPLNPNAVNPYVFAVVNTTADTFGAPWGSMEGSTAKYFDDIKKLQFSEFAINLSALGLDSRINTQIPCENLLGTLIVKTRSSSSFTAELKDFAGPYKFGNTETPQVSTQNLVACKNADGTNPAFNLGDGLVGYDAAITKFYTSNPNTMPVPTPIASPGSYTPTANSTTIYVRTEPGLAGCFAYGSFTVTVNPNPAPSVGDVAACVGQTATFSTTSLGTGFTYQWYKNNVIINMATNNSYTTPILAFSDNGSVYKVVVTDTNNATNCTGEESGTLTVNKLPIADAGDAPAAQCPVDGGNDFMLDGTFSFGTALWTVKIGSATGTAVGTVADAEKNKAKPTVHVSGIGSVTFVLTVTSDKTPSCGTASDEVTVTVKEKAVAPNVTYNPPACDENTFSITIKGVIKDAIYTVKDKNGSAIIGISPASPYIALNTSDIVFSNIPAGSGYQVSVSINGCDSPPEACPAISVAKIAETDLLKEVSTNKMSSKSGFEAYPVPFKDQLTIRYNFDYLSDVKIEVFNAQGMRILSKTDTNSYLNKEITLDLHSSKGNEQVFIVKLTTDRESSTKKVLSSQ